MTFDPKKFQSSLEIMMQAREDALLGCDDDEVGRHLKHEIFFLKGLVKAVKRATTT